MMRKVSNNGTDVWQILICKQFAEDLWMVSVTGVGVRARARREEGEVGRFPFS